MGPGKHACQELSTQHIWKRAIIIKEGSLLVPLASFLNSRILRRLDLAIWASILPGGGWQGAGSWHSYGILVYYMSALLPILTVLGTGSRKTMFDVIF